MKKYTAELEGMLTTANCDRALVRLCHYIERNHMVCKFQAGSSSLAFVAPPLHGHPTWRSRTWFVPLLVVLVV